MEIKKIFEGIMYKDKKRKDFIREIRELKIKLEVMDGLNEKIRQAEEDSFQRRKELDALMRGAKTVLEQKGFMESARAIFDYCRDLIGATSGYVALLSDDGEENEVLFLESGGLPCDVDPELPMPIRGLRAEAYEKNKAVYHNDFMNSNWVDFMPEGHVTLHNVMFAPLVIEGKTVGIIGLANKESDFNDNDANIATGFGKLAAIALQNSRNFDMRIKAETQREKVIEELKSAMTKVKKLSGMLPICSHCKKIRDDTGYWNQIEAYIQEHSEAEFSHGICQDCARKYYSDLDFDNDKIE
jgi:transcriptional regulator with GAF, ATPase, and Fis domain